MKAPLTLTALLILAACSVSAGSGSAPATDTTAAAAASSASELPLPAVPDSLRTPAKRASYILAHFWDKMDFADTALSHNREFIELNFVNFINLYPHADKESLPAISAGFLAKATADPVTRGIVYDLIDIYLASPDSPMQNDDSYITLMQQWVKLPLNEYELQEPAYRLAAALKNRPGTKAADFKYITSDGKKSSLSATSASKTLLLFYDPDCDHCNETITALRSDKLINKLIGEGALKVLAVYPETNTQLWETTKDSMPDNWTVGRDLSEILDHELYDIPEMPGIYLLDKDKTVILRQPQLSRLLENLQFF